MSLCSRCSDHKKHIRRAVYWIHIKAAQTMIEIMIIILHCWNIWWAETIVPADQLWSAGRTLNQQNQEIDSLFKHSVWVSLSLHDRSFWQSPFLLNLWFVFAFCFKSFQIPFRHKHEPIDMAEWSCNIHTFIVFNPCDLLCMCRKRNMFKWFQN